MKNIKNNMLFTAFLLSLLGCSSDDNKGFNTRQATDAKATITVNFDENTVYNESASSVLTYTIALDKPQIADIVVNVSMVDGTATEGEDFTYDTSVTIPANASQAVGSIALISDLDYEEMETFTLQIGNENTANVALEPKTLTVKIGNYQEDDLNIVLNWAGTFEGIEGATDFCDIDMDLELINSAGNYISTSYTDCPESITMPATMPNGTYSLVISLWTNNGETAAINIPASVSIFKVGTLTTTTQDVSSFFPLAAGGLDDGNNNAFLIYTIVKNGSTFTVSNQASAQILQGKGEYAAILKKIQNRNKK